MVDRDGGQEVVDKQRIREVRDKIANVQYKDGYVDPKGKEGFRNPVREVVGQGLTALVEALGIKRGVEFGTALGRSGLHFAEGGLTTLDTVEFDPEAAEEAKGHFAEAGLDGFTVWNTDSGSFGEIWEEDGVELVFIDHAKERYLEDLQAIEPYLTEGALVLLDNTFNRQRETKDAAAYVADNYYSFIFTEPSTDGETTGLMVASTDRDVVDQAFQVLMDVRGEDS